MYSYKISYNSTQKTCYPKASNDQAKENSFESGKAYRITSLSGTLLFNGEDYDYISIQNIETVFTVECFYIGQSFFVGTFQLIDCKIDQDYKTIEVELKAKNNYNYIIDNLDNKISFNNDVKVRQNFTCYREPIIQIYRMGDSELTNYVGGLYWKQPCEITKKGAFLSSSTSFSIFHVMQRKSFAFCGGNFQISQEWDAIEETISIRTPLKYISRDGLFIAERHFSNDTTWWDIKDVATDTIRWSSDVKDGQVWYIEDYLFTNTGNNTLKQRFLESNTYLVRVIAYDEIPFYYTEDNNQLFAVNECYNKICINGDVDSGEYNSNVFYQNLDFVYQKNVQTAKNEYNINPENKYFTLPNVSGGYKPTPINMASWGWCSSWIVGNSDLHDSINEKKKGFVVRGYAMHEIIKAFFTKYSIPLVFSNTASFSQFFYAAENPFTGGNMGKPIFTEISNISIDNPNNYSFAVNGEITLGELFTFLEKKYQVYWDIDGNKLRLEHDFFYSNNLSYNFAAPTYDIDLTTKINIRTGKAWDFDTNKISYILPEIAKYHTIKTQSSTDLFGTSEMTLSGTIAKGSSEELLQFSSDVAYIQGDRITSGIAFVMARVDGNNLVLSTGNIFKKGTIFRVQNYNCMQAELSNFHIFNKPKPNIIIDGVTIDSLGYFRIKQNEVIIPLGNFEILPNKLIKTSQGIGFQLKNVVNCADRFSTITLSYDID